jgi:NRAMP (natural resistance-associated macrophage protein)-like metal ion transporter
LNRKAASRNVFRQLGPGLITGAADDDPSGIATYSQAGAQFGFGLLWTLWFTAPLMIGIQMVSARIGWATRQGLAANMRNVCPRWLTLALVGLLVVANTINIAADIAAMGDALVLILGGPGQVYAIGFGLLCVVLQVEFPYERYVRFLKWLTLALLAYVAVVLTVNVPWGKALRATAIPSLELTADSLMMVVAVLGTTISPYLFFWQAAQEVEESKRWPDGEMLHDNPVFVAEHLYRIKTDTVIGMVFSNGIAWCIMLATAATLFAHGVREIQTSAQAAEALRPLAGDFTFALFALGIIGTGMLAVPVLAGSAAYAVAETFDWPHSLDFKFHEAKGFYAIIIIATLGGTLLDFTNIDPIKALLWSAVANGVISVPIMAVMMWMGSSPRVMGEFVISLRHKVFGWAATAVMAAAVAAMLFSALI